MLAGITFGHIGGFIIALFGLILAGKVFGKVVGLCFSVIGWIFKVLFWPAAILLALAILI